MDCWWGEKKKAFCFTSRNKVVVVLTCISSNILSLHWEWKSYSYRSSEIPKHALSLQQPHYTSGRRKSWLWGVGQVHKVNTHGFQLSHLQDIFMSTHKCNWLWKTCQTAALFISCHCPKEFCYDTPLDNKGHKCVHLKWPSALTSSFLH